MIQIKAIIYGVLIFAIPFASYSDGKFVTITLDIIDSGCVINDNESIYVDFGNDVIISDIDTGKYVQPIEYNLYCSSANYDGLYLMFDGVNGENNYSLAVDDNNGLNIQLYLGGASMNFGIPYYINYTNLPKLTAKLATVNGIRPTAGNFSAAGTLTVGYQ